MWYHSHMSKRSLNLFAAGIAGALQSDAVVILSLSAKAAQVAVHTPSDPPAEIMEAIAEALRRLADGIDARFDPGDHPSSPTVDPL